MRYSFYSDSDKEVNRTDYTKQIQREEIPEWDEDGVDEKIQRLKLQIAEIGL